MKKRHLSPHIIVPPPQILILTPSSLTISYSASSSLFNCPALFLDLLRSFLLGSRNYLFETKIWLCHLPVCYNSMISFIETKLLSDIQRDHHTPSMFPGHVAPGSTPSLCYNNLTLAQPLVFALFPPAIGSAHWSSFCLECSSLPSSFS